MDYAVLISGEGYWISENDEPPQEHEFFVWRCVRAESETEAKWLALQAVRNDETLNAMVRNPPENPPKLEAQEIRHGFGELTPPGSGYIFYRSGDEEKPPRGFLTKVAAWFTRRRT